MRAFSQINQIPGFGRKAEKSESGTQLEFRGVTIKSRFEGATCKADLPLLPDRVAKVIGEVAALRDLNAI